MADESVSWLGLTVVAAGVSTAGSLLGIFLSDLVFSRTFETWKQKKELEQIYQKYRDPLMLSGRELWSRLAEILDNFPSVYLDEEVLRSRPERQVANSSDDPYFRRYKLVSTVYRIAAFLGLLELYRQELVFLHPGKSVASKRLESALNEIRADFADGQINNAKDWETWVDVLIFREELRAIGECMLEARGNGRTVIGFGKFHDAFDSERSVGIGRSIAIVLNFCMNLTTEQPDFRRYRIARLIVHLVDLLELLDENSIGQTMIDDRESLRLVIGKKAVWPCTALDKWTRH